MSTSVLFVNGIVREYGMAYDPTHGDVRTGRLFDGAWREYRDARPGYPEPLFDAVVAELGLSEESTVLEVGAGTGDFTAGLLRRGIAVTALDPGAELLRVLAGRVPPGARCRPVVAAFEDHPLPAGAFDAVICCHSWHWLDPATRIGSCLDLLRAGGALTIVYTGHLRDDDDGFRARRRIAYDRWAPHIEYLDPPPAKTEAARAELTASSRTSIPREVRADWTRTFTGAEFVSMLASWSNHIALPPDRRDGLFSEIASLVNGQPGGVVTQAFRTTALVSSPAS
jgi:SAM-dependent methyltransferase